MSKSIIFGATFIDIWRFFMVTLNSPQGELLQVGIDAVRTTELGMMPPTCWTLNKIAPLRRLGKNVFLLFANYICRIGPCSSLL